jgi:outer membrane immunogenic protein
MATVRAGHWLAAGALGALICATPALAADLPVKAVPVVSSVYNWTGIYGGVHVGYGQGMKDWLNSNFDYKVKGFLGGGQIGVNQQIGNLVVGIEADASWANIRGDQNLTFGGPVVGFTQNVTGSTKIDALATLTGRLGFAQDRWLIYVKGGAAWARETHDFRFGQTLAIVGGPAVTQTATATGSEDRFGWVFGIGSEVALWGNWSFKSEYNYLHMGNARVRLNGTQTVLGVTTPFTATADLYQNIHLAKFGVNYRFGPDGPPAIAPSRPAPGYNWTGAWVGAQGGFGAGYKRWPDFTPNDRFDVKGWIAGATTGASAQAGVFVVGAESEFLWTGIRGGRRDTTTFFGVTQTTDLASKVDWLSLNSLRVGFVPADRWQVYGKGGIALAHETHDFGFSQAIPGVGSTSAALSGSALHTGYLAGAGVEYAFLGNWSAKLEYNYLNFRLQNVMTSGVQNLNIPPLQVGNIANLQRVGIREEMHLVKLGINYHFTSLADVVTAKY